MPVELLTQNTNPALATTDAWRDPLALLLASTGEGIYGVDLNDPPCTALRLPLRGTALATWQSQFCGAVGWTAPRFIIIFLFFFL